jgi:XRE family transcriptional regulator, fatty acid utilization regulator
LARKTNNGKIAHVDLIEIAREFAVSTQAMLWRLVNLKHVDESTVESLLNNQQFRMLDRASFQRAQAQSPQILPDRYVRFCLATFRAGKLSMARLAEFLESNLVDLAEDIALAGIDAEQDVVAELAVG